MNVGGREMSLAYISDELLPSGFIAQRHLTLTAPLSRYSHRVYMIRPSGRTTGQASLTELFVSFCMFLPSPSIR